MVLRKAGLALLAASLLIWSAPAQKDGGRTLTSKEKSAIKKLMMAYVKARSDDDRVAMVPQLMYWGRPGIDFLQTLKSRKGWSGHVGLVSYRAKKLLGYDLLETEAAKKVPQWSPNYFAFGEVVLLRRGDQFAGFRILEDKGILEGKVTYEWWSQHGPARKLTQPGGSSGRESVEGRKASHAMRPNAGYDEYDFRLSVDGARVDVRFVGPAYFRIRYVDDVAFAMTGETDFKGFRSSDSSIAFLSRYPAGMARLREQLQEYIFRTVPGCDPLPLSEEEKASFAQYESAQIIIRRTRPKGEPIVLVKFVEPEVIRLEDLHIAMLKNFVAELLPVREEHLLIMLGNAPSMEGNRFFQDGKPVRPSAKLTKLLRRNFPEDY